MSGAVLAHARDTTTDAIAIMEGALSDAGSLVARVTGTDECEDCATGLVAALCNLGVLAEMAGDTPGARAGFERALARAREMRMAEGVREASAGLKRVERQERADAIVQRRKRVE